MLTPVSDPIFQKARRLHRIEGLPAPLFGSAFPRGGFPWEALHRAGVRHVVCLCAAKPTYDPAPISILTSAELQDLSGGQTPCSPNRERAEIDRIVATILTALAAGEGVLVHCAGGRGRTGTVVGSIMVRLGREPGRVIAALDELYQGFGAAGWPESPWQAEAVSTATRAPAKPEDIQELIRRLPDDEIWSLFKWMWRYYDDEAWPRLVAANPDYDAQRPAEEDADLEAMFIGVGADLPQKAAARGEVYARLEAALQQASGIDRKQCIEDLETLTGTQ